MEWQLFSKQSAVLCPELERAAFEAIVRKLPGSKLHPLRYSLLVPSVDPREAFQHLHAKAALVGLSSGRNKVSASI